MNDIGAVFKSILCLPGEYFCQLFQYDFAGKSAGIGWILPGADNLRAMLVKIAKILAIRFENEVPPCC